MTDDDRINAVRDELLLVCQKHFADRPDVLSLTVCALGRARSVAEVLVEAAATLRADWQTDFAERR